MKVHYNTLMAIVLMLLLVVKITEAIAHHHQEIDDVCPEKPHMQKYSRQQIAGS